MRLLRRYRWLAVFLLGLLFAAFAPFPAIAQAGRIAVQPQARVVNRVQDDRRIVLPHTHPASLAHAVLGSRLDPHTALHRMVLVLAPSAAQAAALEEELQQQQDRTSPLFHQWRTPETFAQSYGVASTDIAAVTGWLQTAGMVVQSVSRSARFITFSGSAQAVEQAFQTQLHHVTRNGHTHIANTTDLSVPVALAPVVRGLARLDDLYHRDTAVQGNPVPLQAVHAAAVDPQFGSSATATHYLAPGDAAVIYNALPLTRAGTDGTGTTIVVLGRSNVRLSTVAAFRSIFGLSSNPLAVTVVGTDPGIADDAEEAYLDTEWAGALATGSTVHLVTGAATLTSAGIDTASLYAVDQNLGDILTLSYGECESDATAAGTAFWNSLWQQAAAQGQTVFVSAGDSGAAGCDASTDTFADGGYGVNALGSSAYNVAVGGTMFVDFGPAQFWGTASGSPYTSALGYIPEAAWNQGRLTTTSLDNGSTGTVAGSGIVAGGGGISIDTARPAWQTGPGISEAADPAGIAAGSTLTGLHRLVPDVAMPASFGHVGTLYCGTGTCGSAGTVGVVGGTSLSAPLMASAQALINAKNGGRQGNANYIYYALAARQAGTRCQAATGTPTGTAVSAPASTCDFHDVVTGDIEVPIAAAGSLGIGFSAAAGFDEATGLGSVNIANLAQDWATANFRTATATLSLTPASGIAHGTTQSFTVTASTGNGTGTPTGSVTLLDSSGVNLAGKAFSLTGGSVSGTVSTLPAGDYTVHAHYAGDSTFAAADSAAIHVHITAEASTLTLTPPSSSVYGTTVTLQAAAAAHSGNGTPTGSVVFTLQGTGTLPSLTTTLDSNGLASLVSGAGSAANYAVLPAGAYTATAAYAGNASFLASTASTGFTVARATPSAQLTTAASTPVALHTAVTLQFSIAVPLGGTTATGSVVFSDGGEPLCTVALQSGTAVCTTSALAVGAHTATATYPGDGNYLPTSATLALTVADPSAPQVSLAATPATAFVGSVVTLAATLQPAPAAATPVQFFDGGTSLGTASTSGTTALLTLPALTAGTHTFTATTAATTTQGAGLGTTTLTVAPALTAVSLAASGTGSVLAVLQRNPTTAGAPPIPPTGPLVLSEAGGTLATAIPQYIGGTYQATFALTTGTHTLTATYAGDSNYRAAGSSPLLVTVQGTPPTLTVAPVTLVYGTPTAVATAAVTPAQAGTLTFAVDTGAPVASTCTAGVCTATLATGSLPAGSHVLLAAFTGPNGNATANGTLTVTPATALLTLGALDAVDDGAPHAATITTVPANLPVALLYNGQSTAPTAVGSYTVVATVGGNYTGTATGTLRITPAATLHLTVATHGFGDSPFAVTATSTSAAAVTYAVLSGPATIAGNIVTLTGAGTVVVQASQPGAIPAQASFLVNRAVPTLAWNPPAAMVYGTTLSTAQLAAAATLNGQLIAGTYGYTPAIGAMPDAGTTPLQVRFTPADAANIDPATANVTLQVMPAVTALTLASSGNPAATGSAVSLTATLHAATGPLPTGTILFTADGAPLGSATLQNGTATFPFVFNAGTHTITASYAGSTNQAASSATLQQSVATPVAFTVTAATPTALTLAAGAPTTVTVSVMPSAAFTGTVLLTCADVPAGVTCSIATPSLVFAAAGPAQTASVQFRTLAGTQAMQVPPGARGPSVRVACLFGGLLLLPLVVRRRRPRALLCALLPTLVISLLTGCATAPATGTTTQTAQPGTYTVHLVAAGGTTVQTVPVTLTVH